MRLLLETNVDVNLRDAYGQTALAYVAWWGHYSIASLLIDRGAEVNCRDKYHGRTPLSYAAGEGHLETVSVLLAKAGTDTDSMSASDRTALSYAAESGHEEIIKLLLERGANSNLKSKADQRPADSARMAGHERSARLLTEGNSAVTQVSTFCRYSHRFCLLPLLLTIKPSFPMETAAHMPQTEVFQERANWHGCWASHLAATCAAVDRLGTAQRQSKILREI